MKYIQLTKDQVAMVDDEDYPWLLKYKWRAQLSYGYLYYAQHGQRIGKKVFQIPMARAILQHHGIYGDHAARKQVRYKDGNSLNLQKSNLYIPKQWKNQ